MSLRKVRSGEPLVVPASTFNAFIDAAEDFQRRQRDVARWANASPKQIGTVLVRNDSGANRDWQTVLAVTGTIITPAANLAEFRTCVALTAAAPTASDKGKFVILAEPIRAGEIGLAFVSGACPVQVNVTDATHKYADITAGDTARLTSSATSGARILYKAAATGVCWCVVNLDYSSDQPAGSAANPAVLLSSGANANTDTWDINNPPAGTTGVKFVSMRLYWSGTTGQPVKQFIRTPTYDSLGKLVAVSVEVVSDAFATGDCATP